MLTWRAFNGNLCNGKGTVDLLIGQLQWRDHMLGKTAAHLSAFSFGVLVVNAISLIISVAACGT